MAEENESKEEDHPQEEQSVPVNEQEAIYFEGKKKFEVKMRAAPGGGVEKAIFIGGEILDWQVDVNSLMDAMRMGPMYFKAVQRDIERHFVESVSDFVGRKLTADDIKKAIKDGYI